MSDRDNYTGYDCAECGLPLLNSPRILLPIRCSACGSEHFVLALEVE